jgi:hypothetical protein
VDIRLDNLFSRLSLSVNLLVSSVSIPPVAMALCAMNNWGAAFVFWPSVMWLSCFTVKPEAL